MDFLFFYWLFSGSKKKETVYVLETETERVERNRRDAAYEREQATRLPWNLRHKSMFEEVVLLLLVIGFIAISIYKGLPPFGPLN